MMGHGIDGGEMISGAGRGPRGDKSGPLSGGGAGVRLCRTRAISELPVVRPIVSSRALLSVGDEGNRSKSYDFRHRRTHCRCTRRQSSTCFARDNYLRTFFNNNRQIDQLITEDS